MGALLKLNPETQQSAKVNIIRFAIRKGRLAVKKKEAAKLLGVSYAQVWKLCNRAENDSTRIRATSYGSIPVAELIRHLEAEVETQ